jgi:DNA-binding phage protein
MHRERIAHLKRLLAGRSLYWLSRESGLSYQTVWRTLNNLTEPSFDTIERLALALGYEIQFRKKSTKRAR